MILDEDANLYITTVIESFMKNPDEYKHIIEPPINGKNLPRLFIWCPLTMCKHQISCFIHNTVLETGSWTDNVLKLSSKNPRLMFDIHENIVLIQRIYKCSASGGHQILSGDTDLLDQLSPSMRSMFSFKKYHKTAATCNLIDYIFDQIIRGVNFSQISEAIASLHYRKFQSKFGFVSPFTDKFFYSSILFSFPGNDKVMNIFLDEFKRCELFYKNEMAQLPLSSVLSTDHTFKVGKHIGYHRKSDNNFVCHYKNLFIVLNEFKQVVAWKFCSTTSHKDICDLLESLSKKKSAADVKLIMVDNCCQERAFYTSKFPNAKIKLDLFHAIQRFVKAVPKSFSLQRKQLVSDLTLVFRQCDDTGRVREKSTPSSQQLMFQLNNFLKSRSQSIDTFRSAVKKNIYKTLDNLTTHLSKDCLSNIPIGQGTEANEGLHRLLNRSMIRGATKISPEIAEAIIAVLFHYHNSKIFSQKHECNSRTHVYTGRSNNFYEEECQSVALLNQAEDRITNEIAKKNPLKSVEIKKDMVIDKNSKCDDGFLRILQNKVNVLEYLADTIPLRDFEPSNILLKYQISSPNITNIGFHWLEKLGLEKVYNESMNSPFSFFYAIVSQLDHCLYSAVSLQAALIAQFEDLDTSNYSSYQNRNMILSKIAIILKIFILKFEDASDVCFTLHIPEVVTAANRSSVLMVCFEKEKENLLPIVRKVSEYKQSMEPCNCGKNTKNKCCIRDESCKCKCVQGNRRCSNSCRCKVDQCQNGQESTGSSSTVLSRKYCLCGRKRTDDSQSCCNVIGKMKTRCPCFKANISCSKYCGCVDCGNVFGVRKLLSSEVSKNQKSKPQKERKDRSYQRGSSFKFLETIYGNEKYLTPGKWSTYENACLLACLEDCHGEVMNHDEIACRFNQVAIENTYISQKSVKSIKAKLNYVTS